MSKFKMPPSHIPNPEPEQPLTEDWHNVVAGSPETPVKNLDGTWSAGGLVRFTLCVDENGYPRCMYCKADFSCSGPPNEEIRQSMTSCISYRLKG